jgi:two-component system CheB/CheR fusion protein
MPNAKKGRRKKVPASAAEPAADIKVEAQGALEPVKRQAAPFPIVGIGASAGGFAAIEAFLRAMSPEAQTAIALVIVQHLSPDHVSILAELLNRFTQMTVSEAEDGVEIKPGCAYIIPPNREMAVQGGRLQLFELTSLHRVRHSIDFFFRSLAADQRERSICVILSGTGSDGTLGLRAVKGEGGMVMAQTPESTEFDGMPSSAIATGFVDLVLPPAEMPAHLMAYATRIAQRSDLPAALAPPQTKESLAKITILLRTRTGHDFSQYKESTVARRIERRMALHQIEQMTDYVRFLQQNKGEVNALFSDLLIGVTSFFRDGEAFAALERIALPQLMKTASAQGVIRAWVCGCSTGEEAYSIAILIREHLDRAQAACKVQIFATDLDRQATQQARSGIFPASIAADVSSERLSRFFTMEQNGSYRVQKSIRDLLIFSEQDVLKDPPFSKLDLISCRNLLIYLNADVQKRLIPLFHYALNAGGILFLGSAESIGERTPVFEVIDRQAKLYGKKRDGAPASLPFSEFMTSSPHLRPQAALASAGAPLAKSNYKALTERTLLNHFTSAAVLVDERGEILYFHGRTGNYLEPAQGEAASNVLAMAREGLRRDVVSALHRVVTKGETVQVGGVRVKNNGHSVTVKLTIIPARVAVPENSDLFLVVLEETHGKAPTPRAAPASDGSSRTRITELEHELRSREDYIQTIVEEMEASSEELKSSNEEMQSVNEEMQSANEELETSREELQSVNEELVTVNTALQQKVADLSRTNNDMNNLLAGTGVGTLFVDHDLRITRFTPSITQVINLIESDKGRPLADIVANLVGYSRLLTDVRTVLDTLVAVETEVESQAGAWFLLSIRPYRTLDNVIEGAVITFVDVTKRKFAEQALAEAERFQHAAQIETVGIAFFPIDGTFTSANEAFLNMMGYDGKDLEEGKLTWEIIMPAEWLPMHLKMLDDLRTTGRTVPTERQYRRKNGTIGTALFAAWLLRNHEAVVYAIGVLSENLLTLAAQS